MMKKWYKYGISFRENILKIDSIIFSNNLSGNTLKTYHGWVYNQELIRTIFRNFLFFIIILVVSCKTFKKVILCVPSGKSLEKAHVTLHLKKISRVWVSSFAKIEIAMDISRFFKKLLYPTNLKDTPGCSFSVWIGCRVICINNVLRNDVSFSTRYHLYLFKFKRNDV